MIRPTVRLKQLYDGPDGDVLEGLVGGAKESDEVQVKATLGLCPHSVERGVVVGSW